jgi:hypothetical protein
VPQTLYNELYTHAWSDPYGLLLGYGDGTLRLFDTRKPSHCVVTFKDPHVQQCGDIAFDPQRRFFVTFGSPYFSVWRNETQRSEVQRSEAQTHRFHNYMALWHCDPSMVSRAQLLSDPHYKNSGAFLLTGGRQHGLFCTTDAHGFFRYHPPACPCMGAT